MSFLPVGRQNKIPYPDGTYGDRPEDKAFFIDTENFGSSYQWDEFIGKWIDHKGEIFEPKPNYDMEYIGSIENEMGKKCQCGAHSVGVDKHSPYCNLYNGK